MRQRSVILYDGDCNFCNYWAGLVMRLDRNDSWEFISLKSSAGRELLVRNGLSTDYSDSIILIESESTPEPAGPLFKSAAIITILKSMAFPFNWIGRSLSFFPGQILDYFYDLIGSIRGWIPTPHGYSCEVDKDH